MRNRYPVQHVEYITQGVLRYQHLYVYFKDVLGVFALKSGWHLSVRKGELSDCYLNVDVVQALQFTCWELRGSRIPDGLIQSGNTFVMEVS